MNHHNQKAGYYYLGSAPFTTIKPDLTTFCNHALPHFHHDSMNKQSIQVYLILYQSP